jgi:hypothetical protein
MKSVTPNAISGVVGLSVLAMFIVAIVAGEVRSNSEASALARLATKVDISAVTIRTDASAESKPVER